MKALVLDQYQQAVVNWAQGPAVCVATAGSGKSTCLIERTARLIQQGCPPQRICVLVYNTTAASSFRERLVARVRNRAAGVQASTFHSWGYALLKHWYRGEERLKPKRILTAEGCDVRPGDIVYPLLRRLDLKTDMDMALSYSALMAECLLDFRSGAKYPEEVIRPLLPDIPVKLLPKWMRFFYELEKIKEQMKLIDFSDMLFLVAHQIINNPQAAHVQALRSIYAHVMVDEAQDLNPARLTIAEWLSSGAVSSLYVGDPNQGIYGYGGSDPLTLRRKVEEQGATLLRMPVNRRSTRRIVEVGNQISRGCTWNLAGDCEAKPEAIEGDPVTYMDTKTAGEEARELVAAIKRFRSYPDTASKSCAILSRTNAWLIPIEAACIAGGLEVQTLGGASGVWGSSLGESFYAYLAGCEGGPYGKPFFAILNRPTRFAKSADLLAAVKAAEGRDLLLELANAEQDGIRRFGRVLLNLRSEPWASRVEEVASLLLQHLDSEKDGDQIQREDQQEAVKQLAAVAKELGSLGGIQEYKRKAAQRGQNPVILGSIHKSKGLEFDIVFLAGVNRQKLPHNRASDVWEERRIFYVGATRARDVLCISTGGAPSDFLSLLVKKEGDVAP